MGRLGIVLFTIGVFILVLNTAAYLIQANLTADPYLSGQWAGILWGVGGALTATGALLAFTRLGRPRTYWWHGRLWSARP